MSDLFNTDGIFSGINPRNAVGEFQKSTKNALGNYKANAVQAISPIQNRLKEGVAYIKTNQAKVQGMITDYRDEVVENLNSITDKLTGGLINFDDVKQYVKIGKNGIEFNKDGMTNLIGDRVGLDLSSRSAFMDQMTNMANDQFADLTGGTIGELVTNDGKGFRINQTWRDQLGSSLLDVIGRETGVGRAVDRTINRAFRNSLLNMSAIYGMSGAYADLVNAYGTDTYGKIALINAVQYMIVNGDLISIDVVLDIVGKENYGVINARYPNMIRDIFSSFRLDDNITPDELPALKAKLIKLCAGVYGEQWYMRETQFGPAIDLGLVNTTTEDMVKIIISDETYPEITSLVSAVNIFSDKSAIETFIKDFDGVPILTTA